MRLAAAVVLACAGLAGCTTYGARPVDPAAFPAAFSARALPAHAGPWRQDELLALALDNSPKAAEARAKQLTAAAAARVARQAPAANLTLTAEYSREAGGDSPWLYSAITDLPWDAGARRSGRVTAADLTALKAVYDYGEALWTVRAGLAKAVAEAGGADEEIALAGEAAALRRDRAALLQRRVAAGEDSRTAQLTAQTDLAAAEHRLNDAQAHARASAAALAAALGLPTSAVADLKIAPSAEGEVSPDLQTWRSQAVLSRRDVLSVVADYDLAESALKLEVARQYPEVRIGPGYTWERGVTKLPFNLTLALPPADRNRAHIAEAEARRTEAGRALEAAQAGVLAAVDQAAATLAAAADAKAQTEARDLPLARAAEQAAQRMVHAGEDDRLAELAARAAVVEAELARLQAQRAVAVARVDLEDALRRPFDPKETQLLAARAVAAGDPR